MHKLPFFVLLASALFLSACSSGGSDSPSDTNAHPQSWFSTHAEEVLTDPGYDDCTACHASDLRGSGDAVSCFSCHSYNTEPPFTFHPPTWTDAFIDHRGFAALNGLDSCSACHGQDLRGRQTAPSCFSAGFDGRSCHTEGPQGVPHPLDSSYLSGANHGPDAKADLTACQVCHGESGGPGSNPRFNVGINSVGGNGCESCHGADYAHPQDWPEHNTAGNIQNACTLCHGVALDGIGGVGVSCLECHSLNPGTNPAGCVSCHNAPPNGGAPVGDVSPNLEGSHDRGGHTALIALVPTDTCDRCHSGAGSGTVNHFDQTRPADVNIPLLDPSDTIIWNGINMTCNGNCHIDGPFGEINFNHNNESWY